MLPKPIPIAQDRPTLSVASVMGLADQSIGQIGHLRVNPAAAHVPVLGHGDVARTRSVPNLSPLLIDVVGVAQCSAVDGKIILVHAEERRTTASAGC